MVFSRIKPAARGGPFHAACANINNAMQTFSGVSYEITLKKTDKMDSDASVESTPLMPEFKAQLKVNGNVSSEFSFQILNFTIIVGEETILAHRQRLQDISDYFYCLFNSGMQENENSTLEVKDMKVEVVKTVLAYIFGEVINIQWEDIIDYVDIVEMWQILSLKDELERYFIKNYHKKNCTLLWIMAQTYGMKKLAMEAKHFIKQHLVDISCSPDFLSLDLASLKELHRDNSY